MSLLTDMQSDLDAIYTTDEFAEEITFNGVSGVLAMVGDLDDDSEQSPSIETTSLTINLRVSEVASVTRGQVAVIRGVSYLVIGQPLNDRLEWSVELAPYLAAVNV
jgi:hypothetical protein